MGEVEVTLVVLLTLLLLLIPTNPPSLESTLALRADLISRPPATKLSCPLRMSVASKASRSREGADGATPEDRDEEGRINLDNDEDDDIKAVIAELSLITSSAAETGATRGPDVSARSASWGT